jgi:poly(hydroxyalkanoate) depolymerase family esterase
MHVRSLFLVIAATLPACDGEPSLADHDFAPPIGSLQVGLSQEPSFGSNPGGLTMYKYVPAGMPAKAPLVVALHGCTQSASDYVNAGWNQLADAWKLYVVYPEQRAANGCFRWYDPAHARRGQGDALSIKQMVDRMLAQYSIDPQRVFVTGLSAGGAMTTVMAAAYPDVFAAGAVMAGIAYRCADSQQAAYSCMFGPQSLSPQQWGDLARSGFPGHGGPLPRLSVWQGMDDYTVRPVNADEIVTQWKNYLGIDQVPGASDTVSGATHVEYRSAGQTLVESWSLPKMGHGVAVDPGFAPAGGCGAAGAYVLDVGVCSSFYAARFFGLDPLGEQPVPPAAPAPEPSTPDPQPVQPPQSACNETYATNYDHVLAGRAVRCGTWSYQVCAKGSSQLMGLWNVFEKNWLREKTPGYFEVGQCP